MRNCCSVYYENHKSDYINPHEKVVMLKYKRLADNLQISEVIEAIEACGYYAEMTFRALKDEFKLTAVQTTV